MAREETQIATQILRAGNFTQPCRYASPVMGDRGPTPLVKGRWPKARGDREGEYERGALILSRPPAILWFLSHRWERNSPPAGGEISPPNSKSLPGRRNPLREPPGVARLETAPYGRGKNLWGRRGQAPALLYSSNDASSSDCPLICPLQGYLALSPLSPP